MPTKLPRYREAADAMAVRTRAYGDFSDLCLSAPAAAIAAAVRDYRRPGPTWDWAPALFASAQTRIRLHDLIMAILPPRDRGYHATLALSSCLVHTAADDPGTLNAAARGIVAQVAAAHADWLQRSGVPADERAYFPPPDCGAYLGAAFGSDMHVPPQFVSSTARHLADVIYREETWTVLPILADALQDMGAPDDAAYITYLRGAGPFFRGCLAVDSCRGAG